MRTAQLLTIPGGYQLARILLLATGRAAVARSIRPLSDLTDFTSPPVKNQDVRHSLSLLPSGCKQVTQRVVSGLKKQGKALSRLAGLSEFNTSPSPSPGQDVGQEPMCPEQVYSEPAFCLQTPGASQNVLPSRANRSQIPEVNGEKKIKLK